MVLYIARMNRDKGHGASTFDPMYAGMVMSAACHPNIVIAPVDPTAGMTHRPSPRLHGILGRGRKHAIPVHGAYISRHTWEERVQVGVLRGRSRGCGRADEANVPT